MSDSGHGRATIVLREGHQARFDVFAPQSNSGRIVVLALEGVRAGAEAQCAEDLLRLLKTLSIRQGTFIACGACGALGQFLALTQQKLVRKLVLVDASTRAHPSALTRLIDRIEHYLPLGLPLRFRSVGFDSKPFLQRIRCPSLIIVTSAASFHERSEGKLIAGMVPTSWHIELNVERAAEEFSNLMQAFEDAPAKCPQKNRGEAVGG